MKYSVSSKKYNGICQHFVPKLFPGPWTRGNVNGHRARTRKHKQTSHDTIIHVFSLLRSNNKTAWCIIEKKLVKQSIKIGLTSRFRRVSIPAQLVVLWSWGLVLPVSLFMFTCVGPVHIDIPAWSGARNSFGTECWQIPLYFLEDTLYFMSD